MAVLPIHLNFHLSQPGLAVNNKNQFPIFVIALCYIELARSRRL